jgi:hypothetical protein
MRYLVLKENSWVEITHEEKDLRYGKYTGGYDENGDFCVCPRFIDGNTNGGWAGPCYGCSSLKEGGCSWIKPSLLDVCECCKQDVASCGCSICYHGSCEQHGRCDEPGCFGDPICDTCGCHESACDCNK